MSEADIRRARDHALLVAKSYLEEAQRLSDRIGQGNNCDLRQRPLLEKARQFMLDAVDVARGDDAWRTS